MAATRRLSSPPQAATGNAPGGPKRLSRRATAFYKALGARVRSRRTALELTQDALATAVGAARTSITNLERGRQHLPLHVLLAVADRLDIDIGELMPTRAELGSPTDDDLVPLAIGDGVVQMVSPRTASAISSLLEQTTQRPRGRDV